MQSLESTLAYQNPKLILKFRQSFDLTEAETLEIFTDLKKWLWISAVAKEENIRMSVFSCFFMVDQLWHAFILFTHDYTQFCNQQFGYYLHHVPRVELNPIEPETSVNSDEFESAVEMNRLILKKLGQETLERWIYGYAQKYPREKVNALFKEFSD